MEGKKWKLQWLIVNKTACTQINSHWKDTKTISFDYFIHRFPDLKAMFGLFLRSFLIQTKYTLDFKIKQLIIKVSGIYIMKANVFTVVGNPKTGLPSEY